MLRLHMVALVGVLVALAALTGCSSADQKTGNSPEDIAHMADFLPDRPPSLIVRRGDGRTEEFPPTDSMWAKHRRVFNSEMTLLSSNGWRMIF